MKRIRSYLYSAWLTLLSDVVQRTTKLLYKAKPKWEPIEHPQIYITDRHHYIDLNLVELCTKMWNEDVETFYSCQGGPVRRRVKDGKILANRAYVLVPFQDVPTVCHILEGLNPTPDEPEEKRPTRKDKNRVAVRFDPPPSVI